jgi:hypothetical protein
LLQEFERCSSGAAGAEAGEFGEERDEALDFGAAHDYWRDPSPKEGVSRLEVFWFFFSKKNILLKTEA